MKTLKKHILIIWLLVAILISFPSFTLNVQGIVDGDWIVCIFDDWAIGQKSGSEYVSGTEWLSITPTQGVADVKGVQTYGAEKVFQHGDVDNLECQTVQLDLKQHYINLSYIVYFYQYAGSPKGSFNAYFNRSDGQQLCRILTRDNNDPSAYRQVIVYDELDNQEAASGNGVNDEKFWVNLSMDVNTEEITVIVSGSYNLDVTFGISNFDYIDYIDFYSFSSQGHIGFWCDDFKVNAADSTPSKLWDTGDSFYGCSDCSYSGSKVHSFASTGVVVDEIEFNAWTPGETIRQVVLAVDSSSDLVHMESWLRIGDDYQENRTRYYTYDSAYFMIVWENINLTWNLNNVPLEFKFICDVSSANIKLYYNDEDEDGDGDTQFKYSLDGSNYDGVYNGDTTVNRDLCYEIYYDTGDQTGDVDINVFNASSPSEAIVGWNLTIYHTYTGLIYYQTSNGNNSLIVNTSSIGLGPRSFEIGNDSFYPVTYYANIESGINYTLDAYLVPVTDGQYYWLHVIGPSNVFGVDPPIYDANIEIQMYDTTEGWINASTVRTNVNGFAYVYMIPGKLYSFNITHPGYLPYFETITIAENLEGYTFRLASPGTDYDDFRNFSDFGSDIFFTGEISGTNLYVNFTDLDLNTTDTNISVYEINGSTQSVTLFGVQDGRDGECNFNLVYSGINRSNCYMVVLFLNHSKYGFHRLEIIICSPETPGRNLTNVSEFNNLFTLNYGSNPFGWSNTFGFFVMLSCAFSFGQRNSGVGMVITGGVLIFINGAIGLNVAGAIIPVTFILLGILVQWVNHERED